MKSVMWFSKSVFAFLHSICALLVVFVCTTHTLPAQRTWQKIGDLQQERRLFGALAVSDRLIMVMGGYTLGTQITASCEIIDAESRRILPAPPMNAPRAESAYLLTRDSNIVAISGVTNGDNVTPLCELYNRSTMTWSVVGRLLVGRRQHVACFLNPEEILVVGGRDGSITTINSAEIFNLRTGQSRMVTNFPFPINFGQSEISSQNKPLVFAGRSGGPNSSRSPNVYEYDVANNRWLLVSNIQAGVAAPALIKLYDGRVIIAGGTRAEDPSNFSNMAYIEGYPNFQVAAQMAVERHWLAMAQWNGDSVMVLGGFTNNNVALSSTEWIDLKNSRAYSAPTMMQPRCYFTAIGLPEFNASRQQTKARIVAISGAIVNGSTLTPTVEILEETLRQIPPFPTLSATFSETSDCAVFRLRLLISSGTVRAIELGTSANVALQILTPLPASSSTAATAVDVLVRVLNPAQTPLLASLRITDDELRTQVIPVSAVFPQRSITTLRIVGAVDRLFGDSSATLTCATLRLLNSGTEAAVFPLAYLGRNIEFSVPLSQFPLRIPAGGESVLQICYAPSAEGVQRDTLTLARDCLLFRVPLVARGVGDALAGMSACAAPVHLRTVLPASGETVLLAGTPFPQPSGDIVRIPVYLATAALFSVQKPSAALYNGLGTLVGSHDMADWSALSRENDESQRFSGEVRFTTGHLPAGLYRMLIRSADGVVTSVAVVVAH